MSGELRNSIAVSIDPGNVSLTALELHGFGTPRCIDFEVEAKPSS